jgi:hypothetical protein
LRLEKMRKNRTGTGMSHGLNSFLSRVKYNF